MKKKEPAMYIAHAAIIAALYVVLTWLAAQLGLASGAIQIRISEMLTILAAYTSAAIPGLFIGCLLSNILTGCVFFDIIFGSFATLLGAIGTWLLRKVLIKKLPLLAPIPPILSNTFIVPWVLIHAYFVEDSYPYLMLTVGIGEVISCGILGILLMLAVDKNKKALFDTHY